MRTLIHEFDWRSCAFRIYKCDDGRFVFDAKYMGESWDDISTLNRVCPIDLENEARVLRCNPPHESCWNLIYEAVHRYGNGPAYVPPGEPEDIILKKALEK